VEEGDPAAAVEEMLDELEDVLHVRGPRDRDEDAVVQAGSLRGVFTL
jgi:hypothetical protein